MARDAPLLRLEGVTKTYGEGESATEVLHGADLSLGVARTMAVIGPSGCGKSTLLNIAGTLEPPTSGRVLFDRHDLSGSSPDELARLRRTSIGFVFQHHHLLPQLTALENVLLPALAQPGASVSADRRERGESLLRRVGLGERLGHRPAALSGGERQRVAVVRALIMGPRLVLADEPTGSLDEAAADRLGELLLEEVASEGVALLLVTHSPRLAARMSTTVMLHEGRIEDAPEKV
ncbi:MAG: ABC transporter ATP-binding protein [Planctomycetota bacterium]